MADGVERPGGYGITALVLGIASLALGWWIFPFLGLVGGILAIVFGALGRKSPTRGMATAGLVLGIISVVLSLIGLIFWGAFVGAIMSAGF